SRRDAAGAVPAAGLALRGEQALLGPVGGDLRERHRRLETPAGGSGLERLYGHRFTYTPSKNSMGFSPAARRTYAFFQSRRWPTNRPIRFHLPARLETRTESTLTLKSISTAAFTSILLASGSTSKHTVFAASFIRVDCSVMSGRRIT